MAQYDDICEEAIANYGLISTDRAAELGVKPELADIRSKCVRLFDYRRKQPWPPKIERGEGWDEIYDTALGTIANKAAICPTVDEAIAWANELIASIDKA